MIGQRIAGRGAAWVFLAQILLGPPQPAVAAAADPALPPDSAYVTVDSAGRLVTNGQRIRFWGAIGKIPPPAKTIHGDPYYVARETIRRLKKVGFNMVRDWGIQFDDTARKGDLSPTDYHDFFLAEAGKQDVRIWAPAILGGAVVEAELEKTARLVNDPATEADWIASVKQPLRGGRGTAARANLRDAVVWDPRLEAAAIAGARRKANHVNLHTGLRLADDPTVAIWELTNEQWWMTGMMSGRWQALPPFFRKELLARWNAFLVRKYGAQERLAGAWGFLFPGEDLARGTVLLAPMGTAMPAAQLNDTNPEALAKFKTISTPIGRDQCTVARAADVIEFLLETLIAHKKRCAAELKTWGKSCRLSPLVLDTGIGQSIQAQYMQMQGDAVAHDSYMEGVQTQRLLKSHKRWPFYSGLDSLPQLSNDVPWLEHNRPAGKPFLVYETQLGGPTKYRAEWPMRIAAAGAIQDWDAVSYHYWSFDQYDLSGTTPYTGGPVAYPGPGAYQYHYTFDEVEEAAMRAAGAILRNSLAAPASSPTVFSYGRPALYDPRSMDYGGDYRGPSGLMDMLDTAYQSGMRLVIDPEQKEFLKTKGPVAKRNGFEKPFPLAASPNVEFDYHRGHLIFDAPGVAGYTGFLGQYGSDVVRFRNGVELRGVRHVDPPNAPYPSGAEKYTVFALASEDGKPLGETRSAVLVLVSSCFNTGTRIASKADGTLEMNWGKPPVLVTRVGATVVAKTIAGMRYRMIDFNEKVLSEGVVASNGELRIPAGLPVWVTELNRSDGRKSKLMEVRK